MIVSKSLPEMFTGIWDRDKDTFNSWISLDSKIGVNYDEYLNLEDDFYNENLDDGFSF